MKQIADGVYFIQGQDDLIPDSHTYVIGKPSSEDLTVIDVGLMGKAGYKIESIQKLGIDLASIKRVIMTHSHLDHIGCLPGFMKEVPNAELWMHSSEARLLEEGDERSLYGMDMFQSMCQAQYGIKPGAYTFKTDRKLEGGETLEIGDLTWEVIHIPGHSEGSICLYNRPGKILIPGDVVYTDNAIGRFDLFGSSGPQLKDSLMLLGQLEVDVLLPGHNRIEANLQPGYILETAKQWEPYLS